VNGRPGGRARRVERVRGLDFDFSHVPFSRALPLLTVRESDAIHRPNKMQEKHASATVGEPAT
jgi:hypothetical protein